MKSSTRLSMRRQRGTGTIKMWVIEDMDTGEQVAQVYEDEHLARLITLLPNVARGLLDAGNLILAMAESYHALDRLHKGMIENAGRIRQIIDLFRPEQFVNTFQEVEISQDVVNTVVTPLKKKS